MKKYFIVSNGDKAGPYTISELKKLGINKKTLVWHNGLDNWQEANNIIELQEIVENVPPPIPNQNTSSAQNVRIKDPVDINISRIRQSIKEEKTKIQRKITKKIISETGIIFLYLTISIVIVFLFYQIFLLANPPKIVSEENQNKFIEEMKIREEAPHKRYEQMMLLERKVIKTDTKEKMRIIEAELDAKFGPIEYFDLKDKYLGYYRFDSEMTNASDLNKINEFRISILHEKAKQNSKTLFYILFPLLIFVRYLILFLKRLNPKESRDIPKIIEKK